MIKAHIYKVNTIAEITEEKYPLTCKLLLDSSKELEESINNNRTYSFYFIEEEFKKFVNELYDDTYQYESILIYNSSTNQILTTIFKMFIV